MFEQTGLDAIELAEVMAYATIEPIGEPMADYSVGNKKEPKPMDPATRRSVLKSMFGGPKP